MFGFSRSSAVTATPYAYPNFLNKGNNPLRMQVPNCFSYPSIFVDAGEILVIVATPLWAKCEGEAHTPKSGKLESCGTPENSELDCRGQISSHLSALGVIGKVLKCRCPKWPRMGKRRAGSQTGSLTPNH
jgi:hypothetical protein